MKCYMECQLRRRKIFIALHVENGNKHEEQ